MVFRKRGGANKYCELKQKEGSNRRTCALTNDVNKNSNSCEYSEEKNKCYISKNKKTNKTQKKQQSESNYVTIDNDFKETPSIETIKLYKQNSEMIPSWKELGSIKALHEYLVSKHDSKKKLGHFWLKNAKKQKESAKEITKEPIKEVKKEVKKEPKKEVKKEPKKEVKKETSKSKTKIKTPVKNDLEPFDEKYYELIDVPPDGNCGYHSFIKSMKLNKYTLNVNNIERDTPDKIRTLLDRKLSRSKESKDAIIRKRVKGGIGKSKPGEEFWLENDELEILASTFKVCIHVWDSRIKMWTYIPRNYKQNFDTCINKQQNIYLFANGIHYQTIKRKI
mgnify:CR=1 FL=1|tara:strand:- start:342 stop:1349 length:1008 start_codon:yes stop_codon:yes gene_type:complete